MGSYNLGKSDIIQDDLRKPFSLRELLVTHAKNIKNHFRDNKDNYKRYFYNTFKFLKTISLSVLYWIPALITVLLVIYLLLQVGLLICGNILPFFWSDKFAKDWTQPFVNVLPYAFHKAPTIFLNIGKFFLYLFIIMITCSIGIFKINLYDCERSWKTYLFAYLLSIPEIIIIVGCFIPKMYDWMCYLGIIAFIIYGSIYQYIVPTGGGETSSSARYDNDYDDDDDNESYEQEMKELRRQQDQIKRENAEMQRLKYEQEKEEARLKFERECENARQESERKRKQEEQERMTIGSAVQHGDYVQVYGLRGNILFTRNGILRGYTSSTVTIKNGSNAITYDGRGGILYSRIDK